MYKKTEILAKILRWKAISLREISELIGISCFELRIWMRKTGILLKYFFSKTIFYEKFWVQNVWVGSISIMPIACMPKSEVLYKCK